MPGLPMFPFVVLGGVLAFVGYAVPKQLTKERNKAAAIAAEAELQAREEARDSVKESMKSPDTELCLGKQLATKLLVSHSELAAHVTKMRRKFAKQYGFVVPDIKLSDRLSIPTKCYQIKIHGTIVASHELRIGDVLVITGDQQSPQTLAAPPSC